MEDCDQLKQEPGLCLKADANHNNVSIKLEHGVHQVAPHHCQPPFITVGDPEGIAPKLLQGLLERKTEYTRVEYASDMGKSKAEYQHMDYTTEPLKAMVPEYHVSPTRTDLYYSPTGLAQLIPMPTGKNFLHCDSRKSFKIVVCHQNPILK